MGVMNHHIIKHIDIANIKVEITSLIILPMMFEVGATAMLLTDLLVFSIFLDLECFMKR